MTRMILPNLIDQLRTAWISRWGECFPSAIPLPVIPEIPGRDALFIQLEEHLKSHALGSAARQETIKIITKDLYSAQQLVDRLQQRLTEQHREDWLNNLKVGSKIERLQAMIVEKAPISLGMFIEELDCELDRLRRMDFTIVPNGSDRDYSLMKKTMRYQSNSGSIKRRVVAVLAARQRAVALRTENLSVKEIVSELYRLRRDLPEIRDEQTRGSLAAGILGN